MEILENQQLRSVDDPALQGDLASAICCQQFSRACARLLCNWAVGRHYAGRKFDEPRLDSWVFAVLAAGIGLTIYSLLVRFRILGVLLPAMQ